MTEMKSQECERFLTLLDGYMDGSLTDDEVSFMQAHAAQCASCAGQLKLTREMMDMIGGLDDGIAVPLAAQNAWRQAVHREAKAKKRTVLTRWASGIAAALVAVVGSVALLRDGGAQPTADAVYAYASGTATYRRIAAPVAEDEGLPLARMAEVPVLEADGGADGVVYDMTAGALGDFTCADTEMEESAVSGVDDVSAVPTVESAMLVRSASVVAGTNEFEQGCRNLAGLVEEYSGYFASESTTGSSQRVLRAQIRVPMALTDEFLTALENIVDISALEIRNDNVSAYYYDAESRRNSRLMVVDRLNALIGEAGGEELRSLTAQLEDAYERIDELEKLIRAYEGDVRYANISLELYEVTAQAGVPGAESIVPAATKEPSLSERSASGFKQSLAKIGRFFEDMIVSVAIISPVILIVAAVSGLVGGAIWLIKRKKNPDPEEDGTKGE